MERNVITVDGLASSGKSTISRLLAEKIGYVHFNSGLLYRAVGFIALQKGCALTDPNSLKKILTTHKISLELHKNVPTLCVDSAPFATEAELAAPDVSEAASITSQFEVVREPLIHMQHNAFPGRNIVAEGRDMGTVVFPSARLKFFIEATETIRARRRLAQMVGAGASELERSELEKQLKIEILDRDRRDRERKLSPAIPASDAIIIDNSGLSLTQVIQNMYDFASRSGLA